jgi:WD40 repeat protein
VIKAHEKWCNCLLLLKSGHLCSCSGDKTINIYSKDNNYNIILKIITCHTDFILYILELYDSIIASSSSDGTIKFWKLNYLNINVNDNTYYLIETIYAHESDVWKILFIPQKSQLISCSSDTFIKIWDLNINKNNNKYKIDFFQNKVLEDHLYWVSSIINVTNNSKNINYLVSGSGDNTIKVYNVLQNYNFIHSMNKVICCQQGTLIK